MKGTIKHYEELNEEDNKAVFYSRQISGRTVVIIPKDRFEVISETPTSYILTEKEL